MAHCMIQLVMAAASSVPPAISQRQGVTAEEA